MFKQSTKFADFGGRMKNYFFNRNGFNRSNGEARTSHDIDPIGVRYDIDIDPEEPKETLDYKHLHNHAVQEKQIKQNRSNLDALSIQTSLPLLNHSVSMVKAQVRNGFDAIITQWEANTPQARDDCRVLETYYLSHGILQPGQKKKTNLLFLIGLLLCILTLDSAILAGFLVSAESAVLETYSRAFVFASGISILNVGFSTLIGFLGFRYLLSGKKWQKVLAVPGIVLGSGVVLTVLLMAAQMRLTGSFTNNSISILAIMGNVPAFGLLFLGLFFSIVCVIDGYHLAGPPGLSLLEAKVDNFLENAKDDYDDGRDECDDHIEMVHEELIKAFMEKNMQDEKKTHDFEFNHFSICHQMKSTKLLLEESSGLKANGKIPELSKDDGTIDISAAAKYQLQASMLAGLVWEDFNTFVKKELARFNTEFKKYTNIPAEVRDRVKQQIENQRRNGK